MYSPNPATSYADAKDSVLAIANPQAGGGRAARRQQRWQSRLPRGSQVVFSQRPGHAEELARAASGEQRRLVIAVGGDGTFHEVLNGLLSHEGNTTELGILPLGTADDFAVSLSAQLKQQKTQSLMIDVGLVEWKNGRRYFGNVLGIGLTGRVAQASRWSPGLPARLRYSLALMRCLWGDVQAPMVRLSYDDEPVVELPVLSLTVASGMREGSFRLMPWAKLDDGQFDVLQVARLTRLDLVRYFPGLVMGCLPENDLRIATRCCRSLTIESEQRLAMHLDGELPRGLPTSEKAEITVRLLASRLRVTAW